MHKLEKRVKALEVNRHTLSSERLSQEIMLYQQKIAEMSDEELKALLAEDDGSGSFSEQFAGMSDEELIAVVLGSGV